MCSCTLCSFHCELSKLVMQVINDPGSIPRLIGTALPTSSNFFISYLIMQSFCMIAFRQVCLCSLHAL